MKEEFKIFETVQNAYRRMQADKEILIRRELLENTNIKEPITKGKLKWHGIKLCSHQNDLDTVWIEQRGKPIGKKIVQKINVV